MAGNLIKRTNDRAIIVNYEHLTNQEISRNRKSLKRGADAPKDPGARDGDCSQRRNGGIDHRAVGARFGNEQEWPVCPFPFKAVA